MKANWGNSGEITSADDDDISKHSKKRKFQSETNKQLSFPASKYKCCETLVEHDPFSKESVQAKVFYTYVRKSLAEVDEDIEADSAQESTMTAEDSFSVYSGVKPHGYTNADSYCGSSSSYSCSGAVIPRSADSYFSSTTTASVATSIDREYNEIGGNENCDDLDDFGHCLGYLVSGLGACERDSKEQMDEELDGFLSMDAMLPMSHPLVSEELILEQVSQLSERQPTIDQEFEDYFSTLML